MNLLKYQLKFQLQSGDIYGILYGYDSDSNSFVVNQLNSMDEIKIDSNVVTSDLAGTTPANIQVGKVKSISSTSNNLNKKFLLEPTTDFLGIYSSLISGGII